MFLDWAPVGGSGGVGGGSRSMLTSSKSISSRLSGKRKKVSEWALRWWATRVGVSGIWSMSIGREVGMGFPVNSMSIIFAEQRMIDWLVEEGEVK